ncbi:MAG: hypothetical protein EPO24_03420, partial [Bacteroidetes bacterium]
MRTDRHFSDDNNSTKNFTLFCSFRQRNVLSFVAALSLLFVVCAAYGFAQGKAVAPDAKSTQQSSDEWKILESKSDLRSADRWQELKDKGLIPVPEQSDYKGDLSFPREMNSLSGLENDPVLELKIPKDSSFTVVPFIGASSPLYRNDDRSSPIIH